MKAMHIGQQSCSRLATQLVGDFDEMQISPLSHSRMLARRKRKVGVQASPGWTSLSHVHWEPLRLTEEHPRKPHP